MGRPVKGGTWVAEASSSKFSRSSEACDNSSQGYNFIRRPPKSLHVCLYFGIFFFSIIHFFH